MGSLTSIGKANFLFSVVIRTVYLIIILRDKLKMSTLFYHLFLIFER
ncbi:hypothetical protein HMPREF0494_1535 [Limosilactobacillus antri DSM 16041]|uniref:Uncharacterized protein n=1 Tax=Limosilactobacillus antri DSM 16041 TaxID=525309 RepID=C8P891_9LACO|nr:hypothetical protein HMPREF0494_1535 [Limosilactobacillus antri DSM 16041]